jgi:hypothetical protein
LHYVYEISDLGWDDIVQNLARESCCQSYIATFHIFVVRSCVVMINTSDLGSKTAGTGPK